VRDAPPQRPSRVSDPLTGTPLRGESGPTEIYSRVFVDSFRFSQYLNRSSLIISIVD